MRAKRNSQACAGNRPRLPCTARPNTSFEARPNGKPQARATGTMYIFCNPGLASCRWPHLNSNVRRQQMHLMSPPALSSEDIAELTLLEECMWREATRFDLSFQQSKFAPDFVEFGRSGRIYSREQIICTESHEINVELPLENLVIRVLTEGVAQVTYNSHATYGGTVEHARRSSIWPRASSSWVMRFHQGTPYFL